MILILIQKNLNDAHIMNLHFYTAGREFLVFSSQKYLYYPILTETTFLKSFGSRIFKRNHFIISKFTPIGSLCIITRGSICFCFIIKIQLGSILDWFVMQSIIIIIIRLFFITGLFFF